MMLLNAVAAHEDAVSRRDETLRRCGRKLATVLGGAPWTAEGQRRSSMLNA
jgi:hypothetical protein